MDEESTGCCYVAVDRREISSRTPTQHMVSLRAAVLMCFGCSMIAAIVGGMTARGGAQLQVPMVMSMTAREPLLPALSKETQLLAKQTQHLFAELTVDEVKSVANYAAGKLGCKTGYYGPEAKGLSSCFLAGSEAVALKVPKKATALAVLDEGADLPQRFAQIIMVHPEKPVEEGVGLYSVGPIIDGAVAEDATITLDRSVHLDYRPVDYADSSADLVSNHVIATLEDILVETFGPMFPQLQKNYKPQEVGTAYLWYAPAITSNIGHRVSRAMITWFKDLPQFQVNWMHPLPIMWFVVQQGKPEQWWAANITFCGVQYDTLEDMVKARADGTLKTCPGKPETQDTWDKAGPHKGSPAAEQEVQPPPSVVKTWHVLDGGAVRWGEWEFFATVRPASSLAIHDVRFRGERVAYEFSLSDAHAYYSGPEPNKQFYYSDKAFSLPQLTADVVLGLDCPIGSTLLESATWIVPRGFNVDTDVAKTEPSYIGCVFETSGLDGSLWRHSQQIPRSVTGRRQRILVVRTVSSVGNYDYISEVHFLEDGSMRARNEFAGYPETDKAAPYRDPPVHARRIGDYLQSEQDIKWGHRVRGNLVATLHSHFVVWKVDLDILGVKNDFLISRSVLMPGMGDQLMKAVETNRIAREDPEQAIYSNSSAPSIWRIVNPESINPVTGSARGYGIAIEAGPAIQTLPRSHPFSKAGSFSRRQIAVTKLKDEEPSAVHSLDHFAGDSPLLSVDNFLSDRESLVGEDLVCWVALGKEHITRPEDVPLVSNFGVQFAVLPFHYFTENAAMSLPMVKGPVQNPTGEYATLPNRRR